MAVKSVVYMANAPTATATSAVNTERGPTELIWAGQGQNNAWIEDFLQDPRLGMHFYDDFLIAGSTPGAQTALTGSFGAWSLFAGSNSGNIIDASVIGGVLQFVPSSGTVAGGGSTPTDAISGLAGSFQITTGSSAGLQGKLAFEARVALTSITSAQRDAFIGLEDQSNPSTTNPFTVVAGGSSQLLTTTRNLIGFYNAGSNRGQDWAFVFQLASTAPVFPTGLQSLVSTVLGSAIGAGTYYKLGFVYDPSAYYLTISSASTGQTVGTIARAMIKVYVNGVQAAAFLTQTANILTASFPTGIMAPIAAFTVVGSNSGTSNSGSAVAGVMNLDWLRVAQNLIA